MALGNGGDTVDLLTGEGVLVDRVRYERAKEGEEVVIAPDEGGH